MSVLAKSDLFNKLDVLVSVGYVGYSRLFMMTYPSSEVRVYSGLVGMTGGRGKQVMSVKQIGHSSQVKYPSGLQ